MILVDCYTCVNIIPLILGHNHKSITKLESFRGHGEFKGQDYMGRNMLFYFVILTSPRCSWFKLGSEQPHNNKENELLASSTVSQSPSGSICALDSFSIWESDTVNFRNWLNHSFGHLNIVSWVTIVKLTSAHVLFIVGVFWSQLESAIPRWDKYTNKINNFN